MTTDLWMLVAAVGLTWAFIMAAATPTVLTNPLWAMGNREKPTEVSPLTHRLTRTAENMKENLPLFAALVLVAHVSGEADATSALGHKCSWARGWSTALSTWRASPRFAPRSGWCPSSAWA